MDSVKAFCSQLYKAGSWANGPQILKFSKVKIYNADGTVNTANEFALSVSANAVWCLSDLTLDGLAKTMTTERYYTDFMIGIDGCKFTLSYCIYTFENS
jgi:hypothetical protein